MCLLDALGAQEDHLVLEQHGDGGSDEDRIALEDINVPEAACLVEGELASEERGEDISEIEIRIMLRKSDKVIMKLL